MISWIQKYFQHHFRVIFAVLLAVTIISFIFTIGAAPGIGRAERTASNRPFFGHNLAAENEMAIVQRDTQFSSILHQQNSDPMFRLGALSIADELHIPAPTEAEFKDFLKTLALFANQEGQFDPNAYNRFQSDVRKGNQENLARRVIEDDYRIGRVVALLGGPGYVQAHEVRTQLERFESTWTLSVATVDYKGFAPAIAPSEADLAKYFADNSGRYEIQPQISLRYAEFPAYAYLSNVTATEADIKAYYDANPSRFNKADEKKPAEFTTVRLQVELAYKIERANRLATKAASDFSLELYNKKITPGTAAFENLIASRNIALKDLAPFSRDEPPAELGRSPDAADEAFKLNKDRLFSDAVSFPTGSAILFFKETLPARQPSLAEVKAKVSEDYVENEKRKRFVDLGKTLHNQLEARLKAGDTFEKAVAAISSASPTKIEAKTLAPFNLRQRPQDLDYSVISTLESLKKGELSEMVAGQEKGVLVYAVDKKAPDFNPASEQYKTFNAQIARGTASRNSGGYLRELIEAELAKSEPKAAK